MEAVLPKNAEPGSALTVLVKWERGMVLGYGTLENKVRYMLMYYLGTTDTRILPFLHFYTRYVLLTGLAGFETARIPSEKPGRPVATPTAVQFIPLSPRSDSTEWTLD